MRLLALLLTASTMSAQPRLTRFRDIQAVVKPCRNCHDQGQFRGSWPATYHGLMEGVFRNGEFRPLVIRGNSAGSPLIAALEGRSRPHQPRSRDEIRLVREWIDSGANDDRSAVVERRIDLDGVPVSPAAPSFWLSCRAHNANLRLKVIDEATGRIVGYGWPTSSRDLNGQWSQWKVEIPRDSMKLPGTVTLRLHVAAEDPDGVVFLLEPKRTPDAELLRQKDFQSAAMPNPPPHQDVTFRYVLRAPDVKLSVVPEGGGPTLFTRSDRDLPANRVLQTDWKLAGTPAVKAGWYTARFRCNSRTPGVFQPDMAVLFRISR
jgi:hypothetical protein